jgi:DNA polymerase III alpha subunit
MIQNNFGEMIWSESDVMHLIMQGRDVATLSGLITDATVNLHAWPDIIDPMPNWSPQQDHNCTVPEYHALQQQSWHMPDAYKNLDIAQHVLSLCSTEAELQRCGEELLLYHERDLFDLLRYLTYLVAVMKENSIIWGVGRGSSVASHVLYLLGVHRINSLHYNLDIGEFLR